jgi:predicted transcriptional regulator
MDYSQNKETRKKLYQRSRVPVTNEITAKIIELFTCEKENQLTRISQITGISYHKVFKIIDEHSKSIVNYRTQYQNDKFLTLESSINQK